jgi:hypothetical protein
MIRIGCAQIRFIPAALAFRPLTTMTQTAKISLPSLNKQITVPTGLFINNEFVLPVDGGEFIQCVDHHDDSDKTSCPCHIDLAPGP